MGTRFLWAGLALVSACAGPVYEGKYDYESGWRMAKVTQAGSGGANLSRAARDCRAELPIDAVRGRTFARVAFYNVRHFQTMIARAAPGYTPEPDDAVYVNKNDCGRDLERVTRNR